MKSKQSKTQDARKRRLHGVVTPRFHAEECAHEGTGRRWTVYDRGHHDALGQKIGLYKSKRAAQREAHRLGCQAV